MGNLLIIASHMTQYFPMNFNSTKIDNRVHSFFSF